ncbi:MAG: LD-carboxypeptidase [Chloroflexi bacterium]|nr:LD-carboxypeptidase [Chloroflexota bacterium]
MSALRIPPPIVPGDVIGVTAPSAGVGAALRARFDFCAAQVRARGFIPRMGTCLFSDDVTSASPQSRAAELMAMLTDDSIHAVMPPWGGDLLIEILPLLDFDAIARATPKWYIGWSDCTTFMLPLLTLSNRLSLHGMNFMDAAFKPAPGAAWWRDVVSLSAGDVFTQQSFSRYQKTRRDYGEFPEQTEYTPDTPTRWRVLGAERDVAVAGRLIGGCADVLSRLIGTPYGDVERFAHEHAPDGVIVYLENCEMLSNDAARCWNQFKLAGWFRHATALIIGRTEARGWDSYNQHRAIADAFGDLPIPVLYDVDFGHQAPQQLIVNGAQARVRYNSDGRGEIAQRLA